jgi:hypothetical protein
VLNSAIREHRGRHDARGAIQALSRTNRGVATDRS